jgi:hypothetical protein
MVPRAATRPGPCFLGETAEGETKSAHWLPQAGRLLYTHNPFHLLSVAFVLHSTRLWLNTRAWPYDPWPLMYIVGGYILLVAVIGCLVIRRICNGRGRRLPTIFEDVFYARRKLLSLETRIGGQWR